MRNGMDRLASGPIDHEVKATYEGAGPLGSGSDLAQDVTVRASSDQGPSLLLHPKGIDFRDDSQSNNTDPSLEYLPRSDAIFRPSRGTPYGI